MTTKTKDPTPKMDLMDKTFLDRTPLEDAYVEAWLAVRSLSEVAKEAEARLQRACQSGDPLKHPLPYSGVDADWHLAGQAARAERRLTKLLTMIRADAQ